MAIRSALVGVMCAMTVAMASAQEEQTYESIFDFVSSRSDLGIFAQGMNLYPDIALRFADPSLNVTAFIPTNQGIKGDMAYFYGLAGPVSTYEAVKIMFRNNAFLYPAVVPDPASMLSGRSQAAQLWSMIQDHVLDGPMAGAHMLEDLVPNEWYPSALPFSVQGLPPQRIRVLEGYKTVQSSLIPSVNIIESNIKVGKSIVHIIDNVLWPDFIVMQTPFSSIADIFKDNRTGDVTIFPQIMAQAAKSPEGAIDLVKSKVPLTIFAPTDLAIKAFLSRNGMSLKDLLANKRSCAKLVKAHSMSSAPAASYALFLLDLITLSIDLDLSKDLLPSQAPMFLPGLDGMPRRNYIYNLLGQELNTTTSIVEFTKGPTYVGFGGPSGKVLTLVNFGGTVAIKDGVASSIHKIDTVLMDSLKLGT